MTVKQEELNRVASQEAWNSDRNELNDMLQEFEEEVSQSPLKWRD